MNASQKAIKYTGMAFAVFLACTIIYGILSAGIGIVDLFVGGNSAVDFDETYEDVKSIKIDNGTGKLVIKNGDAFRVVGENVDKKFSSKLRGGVLDVRNENNIRGLWNGNSKKGRCMLTVYVPQGVKLERLYVDMGVGNGEMEGLEAGNLEIDMGTGNLTLDHIKTEYLDLDGGVGNAEIRNITFEKADIDGGVGNVTMDPVIGSRTDFSIDMDSGVGTVRIDGQKLKGDYKENRGKSKTISIDGGVGSVDLRFSDATETA